MPHEELLRAAREHIKPLIESSTFAVDRQHGAVTPSSASLNDMNDVTAAEAAASGITAPIPPQQNTLAETPAEQKAELLQMSKTSEDAAGESTEVRTELLGGCSEHACLV